MKWVNAKINGQDVNIAFDENSIHIYNAYPIKDNLKMRGYRWNPADKSWYLKPGDVESEISLLTGSIEPETMPVVESKPQSQLAAFPESCSVADLRNRLDRLIREGIRGNIWVRGVIASEIKSYQWASYLDLKDEEESRDIFFRVEIKSQHLEKIKKKLQESGAAQQLERDLPVFCLVEVHLPLRNVVDIRLSLLDILPEYTQAKLRNQKDITLEQLKKEGVLENQKSLVMPQFISRLGLITSQQGTSIKDILAGLHPYNNKYSFYFVDSRMEGANAVDSIINAIDFLEGKPRGISVDAIIIARGGGSEQSLSVFNDVRLCRKVCHSGIPILTAIGHEKDSSAIEVCSWFTPIPSTPSGIGKYLQDRYLTLQEQLNQLVTQLTHYYSTLHQREMEKIKSFLKDTPHKVLSSIRLREERFSALAKGLEQSVKFTVKDHHRRVTTLAEQILKKYRELLSEKKNGIQFFTSIITSRISAINQRNLKQIEKAITKLDFSKIQRQNQNQQGEIREESQHIFTMALRNLQNAEKNLESKRQLIKANEIQHILKKGFTLALDNEHRVIKSLHQFKQKENAILQFHDGKTEIKIKPTNEK